jgi:hypothetical protein
MIPGIVFWPFFCLNPIASIVLCSSKKNNPNAVEYFWLVCYHSEVKKAMCEFDTPTFVYYTHIVVFVLCLLTAILILLHEPRKASNQNAFYFIMIMAIWTADVFLQWTIKDAFWNLFFAKLSFIADFIVLFFLYFSYSLVRVKISWKKKIIFAIPYIILAISPFIFNIYSYYDAETCSYNANSIIMFYIYFLDIIYAAWATYILLKGASEENKFKCNFMVPFQMKILIPAIWFFVVWSIFYEEIYRISFALGSYIENTPYFIIGNLFFVSLIAFAIIRKDLFEFPIVITNHYTVVVWTIIFLGFIFFYSNLTVIILATIFYAILMYIFWKM